MEKSLGSLKDGFCQFSFFKWTILSHVSVCLVIFVVVVVVTEYSAFKYYNMVSVEIRFSQSLLCF